VGRPGVRTYCRYSSQFSVGPASPASPSPRCLENGQSPDVRRESQGVVVLSGMRSRYSVVYSRLFRKGRTEAAELQRNMA